MLKLLREESGIKYEEGILLKELHGEWNGIGFSSQVPFYLVDCKQTYPFLTLAVVGKDFGIELSRYTVNGDAIVGLHHKLLLQPQLLLEVFKLSQHTDNLLTDLLDGTNNSQLVVDELSIKVIDMQHLILDIEIQLTMKEASKVFMDEIVKTVLGGIVRQVLLKQCAVGIILCGRFSGKQFFEAGRYKRHDTL